VSTVRVVGSVNEDLRLELAAHVRPGETVTALGSARQLGGKGLNQAVAAARAGAAVAMVGAVGADDAGRAARALLADEGVDVRLSEVDAATGTAVVAVDAEGENAIVVVPGANGELTAAAARAGLADTAPGDLVLLQLELPLPVVRAAAEAGRAAGATVVLNAAPVLPGTADLLAAVDLLVVNASELAALVPDEPDPERAAARLRAAHAVAVLVTLGGEGSLLVGPDERVRIPATRATVVDTTGAGDTYLGYLVAGSAAGLTLPAAMERAGAAAAIAVSRPGASASVPRAAELPNR
jgi:ribokinase